MWFWVRKCVGHTDLGLRPNRSKILYEPCQPEDLIQTEQTRAGTSNETSSRIKSRPNSIWSIHGEAFVQWQHTFFVHAGLNRRIFSTSEGKETVSIPGVEFANWDIFAGDIQEDVIKVPVVESDADWT